MARRKKAQPKPEPEVTPESTEEVVNASVETEETETQDTPPTEPTSEETQAPEDTETQDTPQESVDENKAPKEPAPLARPRAVTGIVDKVENGLKAYVELASKPAITAAVQKDLAKMLSNIFAAVLQNPDSKALDRLFKFFGENRKNLMAPQVAFRGCQHLSPAMRQKYEVFYTSFNITLDNRVAKKKKLIDFDQVRKSLGSEEIVTYLISKNR